MRSVENYEKVVKKEYWYRRYKRVRTRLGGWLTRGRGRVELRIVSVEKRSRNMLVEEARKKAKELLEGKK